MRAFLNELNRRKVLRVAAIYIVTAWLVLQVADTLASILELPAWAPKLVFFVLVLGFAPALVLAWAFELTPDGLQADSADHESTPAADRRPIAGLVVGTIVVALVLAGGAWFLIGADERRARDVLIPEIEQHVAAGDFESAYALALDVEQVLPGDPELAEIWNSFAWTTSILTQPSGARVYRKAYDAPEEEWRYLGDSPLVDIRVPFGPSLLRLEAEGYDSMLRVIGGGLLGTMRLDVVEAPDASFYPIRPEVYRFDTAETKPENMVRVPGGTVVIDGQSVELRDYFLGRYEVTNAEFQAFVDAAAYTRRDLWDFEFIDDGKVLEFEAAMARFVDSTGRPGPATWEGGTYAVGADDLPVGGISWYEAAAYARFVGRDLPTVHHWRRALSEGMLAYQLPASNVDTGAGTAQAVGANAGIGWTGTYDMAGNVREWCENAVGDGQRAILGGAWSDQAYMVENSMSDPHRVSAFDRSAENGLRLAEIRDPAPVLALARKAIADAPVTELTSPRTDDVFDAMRSIYDYERLPLDARIEETADFRHWTRQRVSIVGLEPGERIPLYVFLPKRDSTRFPVIAYWPGATAMFLDSIEKQPFPLDFAIRNGYAVVFPVIEGTFDRRIGAVADWSTLRGRDLAIAQAREFRRTIDYIEVRDDLEPDTLGYFGRSWGGRVGAIMLAVEPRLRYGILDQAGINAGDHPDINVVHYLPRVTTPVLQFSGRYDTDFRYETSSLPFFQRLNVAPGDKRHVVSPTGHFVPQPVVIKESLAWLDRFAPTGK